MLEITLPNGANQIIDRLAFAGHHAYVVGGCVRDSLLGLTPHDWDICTSATPDDVISCFAGEKIIKAGLPYGTIAIVLPDGKYDVTTFRTREMSDGASPLKDDLSLRDFTVNAMAYNPHAGIIDPFYGQSALENRILVCTGSSVSRFTEDPLRILRALRFASIYGFELGTGVQAVARELSSTVEQSAPERIQSELCKLLCGNYSMSVLLDYKDIFSTIIPEFKPCIGFHQNNPYHCFDVYDHIVHALGNYSGKDLEVKIALLFHDIGKPWCYTEDGQGVGHFTGHWEMSRYTAGRIMRRLRFGNKMVEAVKELIFYHDIHLECTPKSVRCWLNRIGEHRLRQLLDVKKADLLAQAPDKSAPSLRELESFSTMLNNVLAEKQCYSLQGLAINGRDLVAIGIPQGEMLGEILEKLLDEVIDGELENQRELLTTRAQALFAGLSEKE